ncbi:MAG: sigma-70 family RNA polymerase sigma factor [Candidatus Baltobacteraceae bacterium]
MQNDAESPREARIRALLPLVRRVARRVRRLVPSADLDDLIGDGSIGLIRAVDSFDASRGPSLEQYAHSVVAGSMLNGIRRMDPVSERARRAVRNGETSRYRIALDWGRIPSVEEIDGIAPGFARATVAAHRSQPLSLDSPLPEGEKLGGDWSCDPAQIVEERLKVGTIRAALHLLPERQRKLVHEHYFVERSLRDIGKRMRISPQRASQLHLAAIAKMKKSLDATTN